MFFDLCCLNLHVIYGHGQAECAERFRRPTGDGVLTRLLTSGLPWTKLLDGCSPSSPGDLRIPLGRPKNSRPPLFSAPSARMPDFSGCLADFLLLRKRQNQAPPNPAQDLNKSGSERFWNGLLLIFGSFVLCFLLYFFELDS